MEEFKTNGGDAEGSVEDVSVDAGLRGRSVGSGLGSSTSGLCRGIGTAGVGQSVANELGDNGNGLGRTVVVGGLVHGLEAGFLAVVEASGELDLGNRARTY